MKNSPSTMGQFSFKTKKEQENFYLEQGIVDAMSQVTSVVKFFMGYNLHDLNATHLQVIAELSRRAGFSGDYHMKGKANYAAFFYNFDASTMIPHTKFDMCMTTHFVPKQDWNGKEPGHLQFCFCLTGDDSGILSIPMVPGSIIYYHPYLLTHHQIHNNGTCTEEGCCLNYSCYANRVLFNHFIKSFQQFLNGT